MDWGRAKTILIASFLFLNLLLGYQLWFGRADQNASSTDSADVVQETKQLLADKQIQVTGSIPKDAPKLKQITGKLSESSRSGERVTLSSPIHYTGGLFGRNSLRSAMEQAGVQNIDAYKPDHAISKDGLIVFTQMAGDLPLFDITVELYEQKDQITGFKQTYVTVQSGGEQKVQKVISAYTAIRSLAENDYLPAGSVIKDIRLGYHGQRFDSETQYMLPFWRVVLANGEPYYVQAFTGEVLEGSQSTQTTQGQKGSNDPSVPALNTSVAPAQSSGQGSATSLGQGQAQ